MLQASDTVLQYQQLRAGHPLNYLRPYRRALLCGIGCLVLTNCLAQAIPWIIKRTIDAVESMAGHPYVSYKTVSAYVALVIVFALLQASSRIASRIFVFNAARDAEYDLRKKLFAQLCLMDGGFYRTTPPGDLMSRMTNDLSSVRGLLGAAILHGLNTLFAYCIALPVMLKIDATITLIALLPYPLLMIGVRAFAHGVYHRSMALQESLGTMTSHVQEDLAGVRELKTYCLEQQRSKDFSTSSRRYLTQAIRLAFWRATMGPIVGAGVGISLVIILWLGGQKVAQGQLSLGSLIALNLYAAMLAWPTMAVGWMVSIWQRGLAAWRRVATIIETPPAIVPLDLPNLPASNDSAPTSLHLRVKNLSIYAGEKRLLDDVSFDVSPGTICGIVGRVGSGKSTLAEAIARLIAVQSGTIFFNNRDIVSMPVEEVRRHVAYAPQDGFLFSASIAENITYGVVERHPDHVQALEKIVEAAGLTADLQSFPDGIDTLVGERGVSLSGGQRQRVALARALFCNRPFLILDDSLSAVDAETEKNILLSFKRVIAGRTTLLISHRLSALQHADRIIVLDNGRIVQNGTPKSLLADTAGLYATLYRRQILDINLHTDPPPPNNV